MSRIRKFALTFDDVAIVPGNSTILPGEADTTARLTKNININIPIISAAMDTVTESKMAIAMAQNGGLGVIHQYMTPEKQAEQVTAVKRHESWIVENPITTQPFETVTNLKKIMLASSISSMPVIDYGELVGIVTKRDIVFSDDNAIVADVMTRNLVTVPETITREEAKKILHENRIEKLLVTDKDGKLKGLITATDILRKENFPRGLRDKNGRLMVGAAVSVDSLDRVGVLIKAGVDVIVVDSAHGHSLKVISTLKDIKKNFDIDVIAGNVVTAEAVNNLISAGADAVKVGIGSGSTCTTRVVTGVGVPQITAVEECSEASDRYRIPVISDGGIKNFGDIAKAIAAGASCVMVGNLLAGTEEAPGEKIMLEGRLFKQYRGMGSEGALTARYGSGRYMKDPKGKVVPEGVEGVVDFIGPVSEVVADMVGSLKHAMGYTGYKTVEEFRRYAKLVQVSAGGQQEAHPTIRMTREPKNYRSIQE